MLIQQLINIAIQLDLLHYWTPVWANGIYAEVIIISATLTTVKTNNINSVLANERAKQAK